MKGGLAARRWQWRLGAGRGNAGAEAGRYGIGLMVEPRVGDQDWLLLRTVRSHPDSSVERLADAIGLPRTNFGRALSGQLEHLLLALVTARLVEEQQGRYRLSEDGRRALAEHALAAKQ